MVGYEARSARYSESDQSVLQTRQRQQGSVPKVRADRTMSLGTSSDPQWGQMRNASTSLMCLPPTRWRCGAVHSTSPIKRSVNGRHKFVI